MKPLTQSVKPMALDKTTEESNPSVEVSKPFRRQTEAELLEKASEGGTLREINEFGVQSAEVNPGALSVDDEASDAPSTE